MGDDEGGLTDGAPAPPSSSDGAAGPNGGVPTAPGPSKSPDQLVEEEILALQSDLQTHHRHAAYSDALPIAQKLLELASSHFGDSHPASASAYNNVGLMNKMMGNYAEAREAYHSSLRIYGEVVGKDHASYAAALSNLGMLERGRVLESEAEEGDEDEDSTDGAEESRNENDIDLEDLRDSNETGNSKMSALERMQLNESAIEYFDEAYRIRLSELGADHPHTVTSRTQLGSAMAAAVIAERRSRIGGLVESELRALRQKRDVKDAKEMEAYVPEAIARAAAKTSSGGSRLTRRRWEAAEEHLRGALGVSVENPRGESVRPLEFLPVGGGGGSAAAPANGRRGLTLPPKNDEDISKKERKKLEKERVRAKRRATQNALRMARGEGQDGDGRNEGGKMAVMGAAAKVTTLSAATAAQNLAVFLKNYSDWLRLTLMDEDNEGRRSQVQRNSIVSELNRAVEEARHLYESALHARASLLPSHHPDVVASRFSLAELLDSPTISSAMVEKGNGDVVNGDRANALREEILSAYDVEEREAGG